MPVKLISNPYLVQRSVQRNEYAVLFRYLVAGQIHFKSICRCNDKSEADHLAALLNSDIMNKQEIA